MNSQPHPTHNNRIGLLPRLGAFFIDMIILSIILNLIGVTRELSLLLDKAEQTSMTLAEAMKVVLSNATLAISVFLFSLFYWMLEAIIAASPGKLILGLQIAEQNGSEAPPQLLWRRYFLKNAHNFAMVLALLLKLDLFFDLSNFIAIILYGGYIILARNRQTLYDHLSKTAVFRKVEIKSEETVMNSKESHQE